MVQFISLKTKHLVSISSLKFLGQRVAVKAMQKGKITDYDSFKNEISILMQLVKHFVTKNLFRITQI